MVSAEQVPSQTRCSFRAFSFSKVKFMIRSAPSVRKPEIFFKRATHRISLVFKDGYCHCQMFSVTGAKSSRRFQRSFHRSPAKMVACRFVRRVSARRPRRFLLVVKRDDDRNPSAAVRFDFSMSDGQRGTQSVSQKQGNSEA
jgi:hypothetical protein